MIARALACSALAAALCAPPLVQAQEPQTSLPDIEDEVMCPICGTTLELSEAPQAERERELIRVLIADGRSKEEIKDALVAEYGEEVLATPENSGFDLAAWIVPGAGIALAAGALALAALRLRRRRPSPAGEGDIEQSELARLDRDISEYDL